MSNCHLNGYPKQFLINVLYLNPFPEIKIKKNPKFHFVKIILKKKWNHAKVLLKRFHLNGHTIGFRPQIEKLELHVHYMYS